MLYIRSDQSHQRKIKMKGAALSLVVLLAALVAVQGTWERNKVYKYEVKSKALKSSSQYRAESGLYFRLHLILQPHSDDVLIGKITDAEFAKAKAERYDDVSSQNDVDMAELTFENHPLSKPFKINLRNDVIKSMGVHDSLSAYEVNLLKLIVHQFQVGNYDQQNRGSRSNEYQSRQMDSNEAYYNRRSDGRLCETHDVSRVSDYVIKSNPHWVPLAEFNGNNDGVVEIVKTKDSANCAEGRNDLAALTINSENLRKNDLSVQERQRIVVSGPSEKRYTIQSTTETKTLMDNRQNTPLITVYVNTTLQSVESAYQRAAQDLPANLKIVENLNFEFLAKMGDDTYQPPQQPRLYQTRLDNEYRWTPTCWTWFVWADKACQAEFGPEWSYTGKNENCHVFGVRRQCKQN